MSKTNLRLNLPNETIQTMIDVAGKRGKSQYVHDLVMADVRRREASKSQVVADIRQLVNRLEELDHKGQL